MGVRDFLARQALSATTFMVRNGASLPGFDTTGSAARTSGIRGAPGGHINSLLSGAGSVLRRQSRDAVRKNAYAGQAIDKYVSNAIGTGIRPRSMHPDEKKRLEIHELWNRFVDESDASGNCSYYGQQVLGLRSMLEGADCFGRFRARRPSDGLTVPFQLELMESEQVPLELTRSLSRGAGVIRCGIEYDGINRKSAYHVLPYHPEDHALLGRGAGQAVRIPADRMIHLFKPLRPGQVRGVPALASVLLRLYELDQFEDATLKKQQIAAMITGFITKTMEDSGSGSPLGGAIDPLNAALEIMHLEPGTFPVGRPGEDVKFADPPEIGAGVDDFVKRELRAIAAGGSVTYEQLSGDLSGVNYSSIRAGLLEFRREVEQFQTCFFIYQFCRPTWREFIDTAVISGVLDAADFHRNRHHYYGVRWVPQGFKWTDPVKEVAGLIMAIRAGLISRSEAIQMSGYDPEVIDNALAEDAKRAERLGLILDSNAKHTSKAGVTNARSEGVVYPDENEPDPNADPDAADRAERQTI